MLARTCLVWTGVRVLCRVAQRCSSSRAAPSNEEASCCLLWVHLGVNNKAYKPTVEEIKVKYCAKFRGKNHEEEQERAMVEGVMSPRKPPRAAGSPPARKSPRLSK